MNKRYHINSRSDADVGKNANLIATRPHRNEMSRNALRITFTTYKPLESEILMA